MKSTKAQQRMTSKKSLTGTAPPKIYSKSYVAQKKKILGSGGNLTAKDGCSIRDPCSTILGDETLDLVGCGYESSTERKLITWTLIFLTLGLLRLIFHWKSHWYLKCTHKICPLSRCTKMLLQDQYGQYYVEDVKILPYDEESTIKNKGAKEFSYKEVNQVRKGDKNSAVELLTGDEQLAKLSNGKDLDISNYKYLAPILGKILSQNHIRYFDNKRIKYIWIPEKQDFEKLRGMEENIPCTNFYKMGILSSVDKFRRKLLYGPNDIHIEITSRLTLLFLEVLNPFYVFQVYSCILWIFQDYYYFVGYIILLSIILISVAIRQTRKMQRDLRNLVTMTGSVQVLGQGGNTLNVPSEDLVPGDIILIPENESTMLCDAVVLNGNVIVNESMLTGESVAFTKTPLEPDDKVFNIKADARNILFNGTKILQTRASQREPVKAMVIRTGFMTLKGELIQSILFPKPIDFKFNRHTYKFIGVLAMIAIVGFFYTLGLMIIAHKADPATIAIRALDLITITVSPALPLSMAIGVIFAQRRLKRLGIFCISPKTINLVAALNLICFDKTGTITQEDLDMLGVVPINRDNHFESCQDIVGLSFGPLLRCLICCHTLTKLDGKFIGDPLDIKMFNCTHWAMKDSFEITKQHYEYSVVAEYNPPPDPKTIDKTPRIGVIRQFPFSSAAQSMSVIAIKENSQELEFFTKGSPEMLSNICTKSSMPMNYMDELLHYTKQGYRVIALAWKPLGSTYSPQDITNLKRQELEREMTFLGFMILENRPKPDSREVIQVLHDAAIRSVMITGDNIYTAICVAKDVDMVQKEEKVIIVEAYENPSNPNFEISKPVLIYKYAEKSHFYSQSVEKRRSSMYKPRDKEEQEALDLLKPKPEGNRYHFAISGKTLKAIQMWHPYLLPKILSRGTIYARMSPEQKAQLIESFQSLGYYVGMCGDGANDCGALKMAHAGISLSENESSIASPFTSKTQSISCVPTLLREGRAALVTSFGIFKYLASYSMVQFVSVTILYWVKASLTDFEYLYVDLFEMMFLMITFGRTQAYQYLSKERPPLSLINFLPIFSIISGLIINVCAQLTVFILVTKQPWFEPLKPAHPKDYYSYQNACVFSISNFQYIILAIIFSKGPPFRKRLYTNYWFVATAITLTIISTYILLFGHPKFLKFLQYRQPPDMNFRLTVLGIAAINCLVLVINERILVQKILYTAVHKVLQKKKASKYPFQRLENAMEKLDPDSIVDLGLEPSDHVIDLGFEERSSQVSLSPQAQAFLHPDIAYKQAPQSGEGRVSLSNAKVRNQDLEGRNGSSNLRGSRNTSLDYIDAGNTNNNNSNNTVPIYTFEPAAPVSKKYPLLCHLKNGDCINYVYKKSAKDSL